MLNRRSLQKTYALVIAGCLGPLAHAQDAAVQDYDGAPSTIPQLQISGDQLWFHTLGGDAYLVRKDEIWRIRRACNPSEPPGSTIIDFAYVRLFVSEPFEAVLRELRLTDRVAKLTAPNGVPVYIVAKKIVEVYEPVPGVYHQNAKSIVGSREGRQQVQESKEHVSALIGSINAASLSEDVSRTFSDP